METILTILFHISFAYYIFLLLAFLMNINDINLDLCYLHLIMKWRRRSKKKALQIIYSEKLKTHKKVSVNHFFFWDLQSIIAFHSSPFSTIYFYFYYSHSLFKTIHSQFHTSSVCHQVKRNELLILISNCNLIIANKNRCQLFFFFCLLLRFFFCLYSENFWVKRNVKINKYEILSR